MWSKLCDPIASRAVEAMGGMIGEDPAELAADLPPEMRAAMTAMPAASGRSAGLGDMMRRIGGMMVGGQTGAAVGALAEEVVSSTDVGLPLGPAGHRRPAARRAWPRSATGLGVSEDEVRLFLALREAAHHRLFAHVPWLRARLLGAVEDYARGIKVDADALRDAMPQIDPTNPEALNEALSGRGAVPARGHPGAEDRAGPAGDHARAGRGLGRHRRRRGRGQPAAAGRRPGRGHPAAPGGGRARPSGRSPRWSAWSCGPGGCARRRRSGRG